MPASHKDDYIWTGFISLTGQLLPETGVQAEPERFPESILLSFDGGATLLLLYDRLDQLDEDIAYIILPEGV